MLTERVNKIINYKYFNILIVIIINLFVFVICNLLFQLRYETIDDFTIMKIISKLDGTYNILSVHIHPILSFFIMMLYKTGININWYTIFLLSLHFLSFTIIGIILLSKNKKIGIICYSLILSCIYPRLLLIINYTSIASITILSGVISLIYYLESKNKKYKAIGLITISIGAMLRWKSAILSLPFLVIYSIYRFFKEKDFKLLNVLCIVVFIILGLIISNEIIYRTNSVYKNYTKFNEVRTYLFDYNILDYYKNKEIFDKNGWTYEDWKLFYNYSFADENFYNTDSLNGLRESIDTNNGININKIEYTFKLLYLYTKKVYLIFFIGILLITLFSFFLNENKGMVLSCFVLHIFINFVLCYTKPVYRVIISLYSSTIIIMLYMITDREYKENEYIEKVKSILIILCIIIYNMINVIDIYKTTALRNIDKNFSIIRDVINYTNVNKENAYVYPNVLANISLAYTVYEKIPDNTFENLFHMGDWDIYSKEYYNFKERYNIDNIITDLYKKDNLYIISGDTYGADNIRYTDNVETLIKYIKTHYNEEIEYKIVKEFTDSIKIYKLYKK